MTNPSKAETIIRLSFSTFLLVIFICKFAYPSLRKYLDAGVFIDRSWTRMEISDLPSVTLCALNKVTGRGWKNETLTDEDLMKPSIEFNCGSHVKMDSVIKCINNETFDITETIQPSNNSALLPKSHFINPVNPYWMSDITYANQGTNTHQSSIFYQDFLLLFFR